MPSGRTAKGDATRERLLAEFAKPAGTAPSIRELADTLGIGANAVRYHIGVLVKDGRLVGDTRIHRGVHLSNGAA